METSMTKRRPPPAEVPARDRHLDGAGVARGDVAFCMVNNEGASEAAFLGVVAKDAIIF